MPKRTDLKTILLIGSGPIVIGQGAEFDYSGTQAVRALKEEGYRVVLVNSNPATIMTDPELADRTYIEPVTPEWVAKVIERERPDALLPTMGGQTALNVAMALERDGTLARYGVELIGANERAIRTAEDREEFAAAVRRIGLATPPGRTVRSLSDGLSVVEEIGYPAILRPSFTLGGTGGVIAYNLDEFEVMVLRALDLSPVHSVLVERSVIGWKEYELEVMRDGADNVVIVCSIENLDPMGPYRRLDHRRPGNDPERPRVPDDARRLDPDHPGNRRRGGGLQHPVRGRPRERRAAGDRDESPGVPLLRAGLQGDRIPDRPDRRQVGGGVPARRAAQRHHPDHAGVVRAGAGLRGRENSPVRLREVPGRRSQAHHPDEIRR
jgi:hypothetical protein